MEINLDIEFSLYHLKLTTIYHQHETIKIKHNTLPSNKSEPGEAIVEGVATGHAVNVGLRGRWGELSLVMVHLPHQLQALSENRHHHVNKLSHQQTLFK